MPRHPHRNSPQRRCPVETAASRIWLRERNGFRPDSLWSDFEGFFDVIVEDFHAFFAKVCIVGEVSSGLILNAWLLDEFQFCCHQSFQQQSLYNLHQTSFPCLLGRLMEPRLWHRRSLRLHRKNELDANRF